MLRNLLEVAEALNTNRFYERFSNPVVIGSSGLLGTCNYTDSRILATGVRSEVMFRSEAMLLLTTGH